jgi:hypothetical protein
LGGEAFAVYRRADLRANAACCAGRSEKVCRMVSKTASKQGGERKGEGGNILAPELGRQREEGYLPASPACVQPVYSSTSAGSATMGEKKIVTISQQ